MKYNTVLTWLALYVIHRYALNHAYIPFEFRIGCQLGWGGAQGWGGALMCFVAGGSAEALSPGFLALLKGALFPVGLSMIIFSGTELLTGNFLTQVRNPQELQPCF